MVSKWLALAARGSFIAIGVSPDPWAGTHCWRGQSHSLSRGPVSDCTFVPVTSPPANPPPSLVSTSTDFIATRPEVTSRVALERCRIHQAFHIPSSYLCIPILRMKKLMFQEEKSMHGCKLHSTSELRLEPSDSIQVACALCTRFGQTSFPLGSRDMVGCFHQSCFFP